MLIAFWIVAGLAALAFFAAGVMKAVRPKPALAAGGMGWVDDFSGSNVTLIGVAEVVGALGLVLPVLTGIAPILSPIAGIALTVLMIGAVVTHVRRQETPVPPLVLGLLAAAASVLGFFVVLA